MIESLRLGALLPDSPNRVELLHPYYNITNQLLKNIDDVHCNHNQNQIKIFISVVLYTMIYQNIYIDILLKAKLFYN